MHAYYFINTRIITSFYSIKFLIAMKKLCFIFLLTTWSAALWAQQVQDSTKVEVLDEVVLSVTRAKDETPNNSNVSKEDIETINLGQDLPILNGSNAIL